MTSEEVIEIFLQAAEVNRKLPDTGRPAKLKGMNHGYIHDTADVNGWSSEDKHAMNWKWLEPENLRLTTNDVGIWQAAMEIMKLCPHEEKRRALWAWSDGKVGGRSFASWCCNVEGISKQLGNLRRKAAISQIVAAFARKPLQHIENGGINGFTDEGEIGDKTSMVGDRRVTAWMADGAKPVLSFDEDLQDFSWASAMNARRREREAKRRKAA